MLRCLLLPQVGLGENLGGKGGPGSAPGQGAAPPSGWDAGLEGAEHSGGWDEGDQGRSGWGPSVLYTSDTGSWTPYGSSVFGRFCVWM